jgi:hypothetical protein
MKNGTTRFAGQQFVSIRGLISGKNPFCIRLISFAAMATFTRQWSLPDFEDIRSKSPRG